MGPADGCILFETFVTPAALDDQQRYAGSPPLSFERHEKLEKRTISLLRCSGLKTSRLNRFDYSTFDFAIGFRFERWMPKVMARPSWTQGLKIPVMWFQNYRRFVLRAITLYAWSFSKERLVLRQIKSKTCVAEADPSSLALSRRSCGWADLWFSRVMVMARRLGHRVFLATALLGSGLTPTLAAELVSPLDGFQATLGSLAISIYYEPIHTEFHVVIAAGAEEPDSVIRFVSNLAPGQRVVVSVPRAVGQPARELQLHRVGDKLDLERSSNSD
jgi:hypothetical protein